MTGRIRSINTGATKGIRKKPVSSAVLQTGSGIIGDAHAGPGTRQVSLLAWESIKSQPIDLNPGDFAENLTTEGIDLEQLSIGSMLQIKDVRLRITQLGKVCHNRCSIFEQLGDCIMPKLGLFAEVIEGGEIKTSDPIEVIK